MIKVSDRCTCGHSMLVHVGGCHIRGCQCKAFVMQEPSYVAGHDAFVTELETQEAVPNPFAEGSMQWQQFRLGYSDAWRKAMAFTNERPD